MAYLFEVIDPYSLNQQGQDIGKKYRTGLYSLNYKDQSLQKDMP
jgi:peptide-methionine (S)-S-oxide reductase